MKIGIMVLVLSLVMGLTPQSADGRTTTTIYLNETFDDTITNSLPSTVAINGGADSRVVSLGTKKKALLLAPDSDVVVSTFSLAADKTIFLEMDLYTPDIDGGVILIGDSGQSNFTLLKIDEDGGLYTVENYALNINLSTAFQKIGVYLNTRTKRFSVYHNDKCVLQNWLSPGMAINNIATARFTLFADEQAEQSSYFVRSIRGYDSERPMKLPDKQYNPRENEFVSQRSDAGEGEIFSFDMEDNTTPPLTPGIEYIKVERDEEAQNNYIRYRRTSGGTPYMDVSALPNVGANFVREIDFNWIENSSNVLLFSTYYLNDSVHYIDIIIAPGGILRTNSGIVLANLEKDRWYNFALASSHATRTFDFYIDGEKVVEGVPMANQSSFDIRFVRSCYVTPTPGGLVEFIVDNYRMYNGKVPRTREQQDS